jgi:hypothetical protein
MFYDDELNVSRSMASDERLERSASCGSAWTFGCAAS